MEQVVELVNHGRRISLSRQWLDLWIGAASPGSLVGRQGWLCRSTA